MNTDRRPGYARRGGGRKALLQIVLFALLAGCGQRSRRPAPPSSPPRPLTSVHTHIDSAILTVHKLPGHPYRGMM